MKINNNELIELYTGIQFLESIEEPHTHEGENKIMSIVRLNVLEHLRRLLEQKIK